MALQDAHDSKEPVVYIVDDDESMRLALDGLFRSVGLQVQSFGSTQDFLGFPRKAVPGCLVLDVRLRGESGLAFQAQMQQGGVRIPVVFMTGHGDIAMSVKAMKAGAVDFLAKPFRDQDMLDAVAHALALDRERLAGEQASVALRSAFEALTPRERQVLAFVIAGLMNKQIAAELSLSEVTVKVHRGQMMKKLGARSVAELVRMGEALGIEPSRRRG